jgi:hypothetical protein
MEHVSMVSQPAPIIIGSPTRGLTIAVQRRSHAGCTDYWDGNWLSTNISVFIGGFRGRVDADLRAEELVAFRDQLRAVYESLSGRAEFHTMEGWLGLQVLADKTGHLRVTGDLLDEPGIGNRLSFSLDLDQTYLPNVLSALDEITRAFPVIGTP